jgi:hypothetical protein
MDYPVNSADSPITEHPDTYIAHIDAAWKDKAPKMVDGGERGDLFVIDGMKSPLAIGLVAAAGKPPEEPTMAVVTASYRRAETRDLVRQRGKSVSDRPRHPGRGAMSTRGAS